MVCTCMCRLVYLPANDLPYTMIITTCINFNGRMPIFNFLCIYDKFITVSLFELDFVLSSYWKKDKQVVGNHHQIRHAPYILTLL